MMGEVDVYLSFGEAVTDDERREFVKHLEAFLSPSMKLMERNAEARAHCDYSDPNAAVVTVQQRAKHISERLGLADGQVTWSLEPSGPRRRPRRAKSHVTDITDDFSEFSRAEAQNWLDQRLGTRIGFMLPLETMGEIYVEGYLEHCGSEAFSLGHEPLNPGPLYKIGGTAIDALGADDWDQVRFRLRVTDDTLLINSRDLINDTDGEIMLFISEEPAVPMCSKCGTEHEWYEGCPPGTRPTGLARLLRRAPRTDS